MRQNYEEKKKKANKKRKKKEKNIIKAGFCAKTGKQRWYNKETGKYFLKKYEKRGYSQTRKNKAIALSKEGVGFRGIGRLLNISNVCAYYWIREYCESLEKPELPKKCGTIELDEMWHFCQKKTKKSGSGQQ